MRKILIWGIVFLYVLSTALQSSVFRFGWATVSAAGPVSRTNLVAVVVDSNIYWAIQWDLWRYANTYVPKQSPGTKLITIPLDPAGFRSDEVHRVLENLYFEWHKDDSTNLVWVIIFGDVPLPTVEVDDETFKSIHPYTDFENQPMFNYDPGRGVWTSRWQSFSQPELRHALIPGTDTWLFSKFFAKLKEYDADPLEYAEPQIWYDDYQLMQSTFTKEQLDEYINTLIFAEDRSYRRINRTMTDVMNEEYADDLVEDIERINQVHAQLSSQPNPDNASNPEVDEASAGIFAGTKELLEFFDPDEVAQTIKDASDSPVPTLINAKQIENNFRPVFALFGDEYLSTMEDNLAAGGRYDLDTIDTTLEKIQIKDQIAIQYIKDMNTLLEQSLDEKIQQEQYMLKYPLPTWYEQRESADLFECAPDSGAQLDLRWDFGIWPSANRFMSERYENFYFGRYAWDVQQYDDLHVYRWDWYNADEAELLASSIPVRQIEDIPFDFSQAAVWWSYGGFAQQTRSMRGTNFDLAPYDVELYDQFKCDEGDTIELWTKQYRGWWSPLNIDDQKLLSNPTDVDFKPSNYDESYMRHPTTNRTIGGPQYDPVGSTLMQADIFGNWTQAFDVSPSISQSVLFTTQQAYENGECIPLPQTDDIDNDWITNKQDDDIDGDGLTNTSDGDIDWDCIPNTQDDDIDGDGDKNGRDSDCNWWWGHCGQDDDDDSDWLPDDIDPDDDNDGTPDDQEPDQDNDGIPDSEDPDDDNDGLEDQDDPDDDNDGIPDDEELDSDGDGTTDDDEWIDSDQDWENNNWWSGDWSGGSAGWWAIPNFAEKYKEWIEQVDMTAFIEWFFVPGEDDKYHNIIWWTEKAESIFDSKNYSFVDLNEDGETDVLMRDKHSIFVKYAKQNNDYASSGETWLVQLGSRWSAAQLQEAALDNDGYINDYKVRDEKQVRFDFRREGNNYDSMWFSRNNTTEDAYVVSLTHKVDVHNNSDGKVNAGWTWEKVTYLLSLPQWMSYTGLQLELPEELDKWSIEDYVEDGTILAVNYFDGRADRINALLENVPAEWYFTKVSALRLWTSGWWLFRAAKKDTYKKIWPRSRQVIAGAQKRWDDARPTLSLELIRNTTQETISQWTDMWWFVLTEYTLSGEWLDNGEVLENRIMYDDQVIFAEKDDDLVLENLYYRYPTVEKFVMWARDQAGNEIEVWVLLDITSPSLQIVDIKEQSVWFDIHAQLSDTIDDGQVVFMNDRYGRYEKLSPSNYPVKPTDPLTIWWLYVTDDSIGMRDTNGIDRASINKDTWEITVDESDTTDIRVNFATSQAEISVIDAQTQQKIFDVSLRADTLESLTLLQWAYTQTPIQSSAVWPWFVWWYCVWPIDDECHIYIDKQWNATIPPPYNTEYIATYNFDAKNNTVVYTLQDLMNTEVLSIWFVPQPLE